MAGGKQVIQAPIDRPLARAYLREFSGWSTAYPPGLSDPTSMRTMENVYVTREGACRIRPGIRSVFTADWWLGNTGESIVGAFEHFIYDSTGRAALLFAVRGTDNIVRFRVVVYNAATKRYDDQPGVFPALTFSTTTTYVRYLQIDNKILALSDDPVEPAILFNVGTTKSAKKVPAAGLSVPAFTDAPTVVHPDAPWIDGTVKNTRPAAETPTTGTLVSSTTASNTYSFGYFYTFETEFGESAPSGITVIKTQRGWSQWKFNSPDASGNAETVIVVDPTLAMDQLVGMLPSGQYATAKAAGAISWNLYQFTWNDTSSVPSVAVLVGTQNITAAGTEATESWIINTAAALADSWIVPVPNKDNRVNYSGGPTARQGLAVGDRLVLVNDGANQARIAWTANVPGEYTNMSPSKGGGQKTLSTGNLLVPMNVQLWQNPQSTDTIVILCKGLDGYHGAFYMAPAQVTGQSDSTVIMGFEETTATPGTVSPYGVEVLNNQLYHPLEAELMKSVAANYNISHKTMTTDIANKWQRLVNKDDIVSSQHDSRLYYIVNNPQGAALEEDCMGNEIWVMDTGVDTPTWSRWLIQGIALKKLQIGDKLYMAVVKPDAIFILDELAYQDEYASGATTQRKNIPWKIETNTLGANRAHDAWANVYQAQIHAGDWIGTFEWGVKGFDIHNRFVHKYKRSKSPQDNTGVTMGNGVLAPGQDLGDSNDYLEIKRDMMEWTFYAQSINAPDPVAGGAAIDWMSYGQIDFVQFMLMQESTNVNTELGSIQTFEYQRNARQGPNSGESITRNGIPMPLNTRRP
jgi:hypothetical protein